MIETAGTLFFLTNLVVHCHIVSATVGNINAPHGAAFSSSQENQANILPKIMSSNAEGVTCNNCDIFLKTHEQLLHHIKTSHPLYQNAKICPLCEIPRRCTFNSAFQRHLMKHLQDRQYICATCGSQYKGKHTLERHIRAHIIYDFLGHTMSFDRCWRMKRDEVQKIMLQIPASQSQIPKLKDKLNSDSGFMIRIKNGVSCKKCADINLYTVENIWEHVTSVHPERTVNYPCPVCGIVCRTFSRLQKHLPKYTTEKLQCQVCKGFLKRKLDIDKHGRAHKLKTFIGDIMSFNACLRMKKEECEKMIREFEEEERRLSHPTWEVPPVDTDNFSKFWEIVSEPASDIPSVEKDNFTKDWDIVKFLDDQMQLSADRDRSN